VNAEDEIRLRILMLIPHLGVGGAQGSFLRLARFLSDRARVTIALMEGSGEAVPELPVVVLSDASRPSGKLGRWWGMLNRLQELKREHDVTISFLPGVNLLNALAGPPGRSIVSERGSKRHDVGMTNWQRMIWTGILDPFTYRRSGRVVAASQDLAHEIVWANPWAARLVIAIEGSVHAEALVDAADLPVEPEFMQLAAYETVIAFGRLHLQKGYDVLLTSFAQVRAVRPAARLLLIGDGPEATSLRALASRLGLRVEQSGADADVIMPGMRVDPLRYLRLGRVFALPSRYEGLPNSLIEALAAGVPALASDCPWGPRSILSGGASSREGSPQALPLPLQHGLLMPPPDALGAAEIWARELNRALREPIVRRDRAARLAAVDRFDIGRTGPQWLRLAEEMAGLVRRS
jgi:glycosyltransferase involved in cell wall biosynthesis